jgi:hypothetical protein
MAVGQDRVLINARLDANSTETDVYDTVLKRKWAIGDPKVPYNYPYMSHDGGRILVCWMNLSAGQLTCWWGDEQSGFSLHLVPGIDHVALGTIRFSSSGEAVAFLNRRGLLLTRLPARGK